MKINLITKIFALLLVLANTAWSDVNLDNILGEKDQGYYDLGRNFRLQVQAIERGIKYFKSLDGDDKYLVSIGAIMADQFPSTKTTKFIGAVGESSALEYIHYRVGVKDGPKEWLFCRTIGSSAGFYDMCSIAPQYWVTKKEDWIRRNQSFIDSVNMFYTSKEGLNRVYESFKKNNLKQLDYIMFMLPLPYKFDSIERLTLDVQGKMPGGIKRKGQTTFVKVLNEDIALSSGDYQELILQESSETDELAKANATDEQANLTRAYVVGVQIQNPVLNFNKSILTNIFGKTYFVK